MEHNEELARARLAFISAGLPALGAPRRAAVPGAVDEPAEEPAPQPGPEAGSARGTEHAGAGVPVGGGTPLVALVNGLRAGITPRHAVVVALLLVASVLVTVFALGRSAATEVPVGIETTAQAQPVPTPSVTTSPIVYVRVHVAGAVARPGVVQVPAGSIVQDALLAAGGLATGADPADLNLAAPVSDGMQILIGTSEEPLGTLNGGGEEAGSGAAGDGPLDLNTATQEQLESLPGVGPVMAGAILTWREEHGSFSSVEELQEISGIGPKTFTKLAPLVRT